MSPPDQSEMPCRHGSPTRELRDVRNVVRSGSPKQAGPLVPNSAAWNADVEVLSLLSVRRLAREARNEDPLGPQHLELIENRTAETLLGVAAAHRCIPLLSWAAGDFPASGWSQLARQDAHAQQLSCMRALVVGRQVMETLLAAGARPLWIKGMPLAALTIGDYWARGKGDIDILVDRDRLAESVAALRSSGAGVEGSHPTVDVPNERPRFRHSVNLRLEGVSIDLHSRLDLNPALMKIDHDLVYARRVQVDMGGALVDTLGRLDATLMLCAHAGRDSWSDLRAISDMTRLLRMVESEGTLSQLQAEADLRGLGTRLGLGVLMARPFGDWDSAQPLVRTPPRARFLARVAWKRLARGEQPRWSTETADIVRTYLFQTASVGSLSALRWDVEKIVSGDSSESSLLRRTLGRVTAGRRAPEI